MRLAFSALLCGTVLLAPVSVRGQTYFDDTALRRNVAERVAHNHNLTLDWQNNSLSELIDAEARLNAVQRIQSNHGLLFDWKTSSLSALLDTEARLNAVSRIQRNHSVLFDWKTSSLSALLDAEARLNAAKRLSQKTGQAVDWKAYSLSELLTLEMNVRSRELSSQAIQAPYSREDAGPTPNSRPYSTPSYSYPPPVAENGDIRGADNDGDGRAEPVYVRGYTRKDGTYVRGHYRASPRR